MRKQKNKRKITKEEIEAEKKKLETYIESMVDGLVVVDLKRNIVQGNKAYAKMHGYKSMKQIIGKNITTFILKTEIPKIFPIMKEILKKGVYKNFETIGVTKQGKKIPILISAKVLKDAKGKPTNIVAVLRDITERKRVEEKLRSLIETTSDWIWEVDKNGVYTYASPKVKDLLGYKPEEVIGKTPFDFMPQDEAKRIGKAFRDIMESKEPFTALENVNLHKNGKHVMLETSGVPIFDASRNLLGYRGIDRDITYRKRTEKIIKGEIKKLKELDKAKRNFINMVSHELKTPLTAIFAHLELLEGSNVKKGRESLEAVRRNSERLKGLIDNILEISRIESKIFKLNISKVNLSKQIENITKSLEVLANRKNIKLINKISDPCIIRSDISRTEIILKNLIDNAIKFTSKGYVTINARRHGKFITVSIRDTGIGISKNKIESIFKKFTEVDGKIRKKYGGTGLGLSITKQLVEILGGKMGVRSKSGKGSTFFFTLPINFPKNVKEVRKWKKYYT